MFLRNRDEALDALGAIVVLPERREQIIRCTVAIMQCLDPESRRFMADCQTMLLEGGLDALKSKRHEAILELQESEVVAVVDPEEDGPLEALAGATDALRFAGVVHAVFPELRNRFDRWEIARALAAQEEILREIVIEALRLRQESGSGEVDRLRERTAAIIETHRPVWSGRADRMRRACRDTLRSLELEGDPETIFAAIAVTDERALPFLEALDRHPAKAVGIVRKLQEWTATVRALEGPQV